MPARAAGALTQLLKSRSKHAKEAILKHLAPSVAKGSDHIADHGSGAWVWTVGGEKVLDFGAGIGTLSLGHCHPNVVRAVSDQAAKLIQGQQNQFLTHTAQVELLDRLLEVTPEHLTRFFFANSGSEVVENAVKIARAHTGRTNIICFDGGYHGRTFGAMALTTSKTIYRQGFAPLMPQTFPAPYPNCLHCSTRRAAPAGLEWYKLPPHIPPFQRYEERECCMAPLEGLKHMLKTHTAPSETAGVIIEPIMGEGGFLTPPPGFLAGVRQICDEHGMVMIVDEVQSGVGRTGKWWGYQHFEGCEPDVLLFAKGIGSGYPFAGLATREHMWEKMPPGTMGGTFGGNALGCAVATSVIDTIQEEGLLDNAVARGSQLAQGLVSLAESYPIVDVRGRGLMVAMEFGGPGGDPETARPGIAANVVSAARDRGLLLLTAGSRETVRFLPPLNIKEEEVDLALGIVSESLAAVFDGKL